MIFGSTSVSMMHFPANALPLAAFWIVRRENRAGCPPFAILKRAILSATLLRGEDCRQTACCWLNWTSSYGWKGLYCAAAMINQPVLDTQFSVDIVKYPLFVPSIEYCTPPLES